MIMIAQAPVSATLDARLSLIVESYQRLTGKALLEVPSSMELRDALWQAPRIIVAHASEADPVFFYGNRRALELFEFDFTAFTRLPSRYSAEPLQREERERLLDRVTQRGYVDDYRGVRVAQSGRRFMINAATVWNLLDAAGICHGQAATFTDWCYLDSGQ